MDMMNADNNANKYGNTTGGASDSFAPLTVNGLRKLYKNGRGVSNISLTIAPGDVFGLLGSNGSGKTTAIKCICGLSPYDGDIRIFGNSVADKPRLSLGRIGCIVESPSFYANLSAEKNLLLAARYYGLSGHDAKLAAEWALGIVGLAQYKRDKAERFSLGMKARLGLALCFISKPDLMILDEPLNGLDIEGMVEIRNIILGQASSSHAAFLISSHLAAEVEKTCNRVGVLESGILLETARVEDIVSSHSTVEAYYLDVLSRHRGNAANVYKGEANT